MTIRDLIRRNADFIAARQASLEDAKAYGSGQAATLLGVVQTWAAGVVTETPTEQEVFIDGPFDELDLLRSVDTLPPGARITFYLPALTLTAAPKKGHRIEIGTRSFVIHTVEPRQIRGEPTTYVLRCGEGPARG